MNTAQKNLYNLATKIKNSKLEHDKRFSIEEKNKMLNLLREAYIAWNPYEEKTIAFPNHQLKALEKKYRFTISYINSNF